MYIQKYLHKFYFAGVFTVKTQKRRLATDELGATEPQMKVE
jgi:hypothetical protein